MWQMHLLKQKAAYHLSLINSHENLIPDGLCMKPSALDSISNKVDIQAK